MTPKELAAKMYHDYRIGNSFVQYDTEELKSVLNFTEEMSFFFGQINHNMVSRGLIQFEYHLVDVLRGRGCKV